MAFPAPADAGNTAWPHRSEVQDLFLRYDKSMDHSHPPRSVHADRGVRSGRILHSGVSHPKGGEQR